MARRKVAVWKVPGTDFHIERLVDHTALFGPVFLQGSDKALEGFDVMAALTHGDNSCGLREFKDWRL